MFSIFTLPPIYKALIALLFAGFTFPLSGIMVLRLNMLPLRYMLMHSLLLAGAISLAFSLPPLLCYIALGLVSVFVLYFLGKKRHMNLGFSSSVIMVLSLAIASIITSKTGVSAKDTLSLIWGSPFTLLWSELALFALISILLVIYVITFRKTIFALFFDKDIAYSIDSNSKNHELVMVIFIALIVSLSMRFVGALLIDALLLLPVIIALKRANSLKQLFIYSSVLGGVIALFGFVLSIIVDTPPSSTIALLAGLLYIIIPRRKQ